MALCDGFIGSIGNTPLLRLKSLSEETGCEIRLLREEGLWVGSMAGINAAAAVSIARQIGPGYTIVTVLCDGGAEYQSRLFNPAWIKERGFAEAIGQAP